MRARPIWRVVPFLFAASLSGACEPPAPRNGSTGQSPAIDIVDADGRELRLSAAATRIISLVPSATLTLQALGAEAQLVARTDFDTASWAQELPSVGGGIEPSMEAIVAARPDLVIRFGGPQDSRTPTRLSELGIPHLAIRPDRIVDVLDGIHLLGVVTGREEEAAALTQAIRDTLDAIRMRSADKVAVRVAYVLGGTPPWVAGPDTYIDDLIRLAGGINVFADLGQLYGAVSPEEFVVRDIDVIMTPRGSRFERRLAPAARFVEADPALELPGPGVTDAAREVERALHPGGGS
jgi:iron complex transport system substrate-binding protein